MNFKKWSSKNEKRQGTIYGNNLGSGVFTVTVFETDKYLVRITGKGATGKVTVKKVKNTDK